MFEVIIQKSKIEIDQIITDFNSESAGAFVSFIGFPRQDSENLIGLHYDVYLEMAQLELENIVCTAEKNFSTEKILVIHRYGDVPVKEISILIFVLSAHRDAAFEASRFIIDEVKKTVPIWKKNIEKKDR